MDSPVAIKEIIKAEANNLGFSLCATTTTESPESFPRFVEWLEHGYHAGMQYLSRKDAIEKRQSPALMMENGRSIIVLALSYDPTPKGQANSSAGKVAAYARYADYHLVIPALIERMMEGINARLQQPLQWQSFTDSAPILEHDLAYRAGLGWIGKNSLLIHPKLGSYFFLAEVTIDVDLPKDPTIFSDHCGNCTRCIDACPTQCILPNRTIDANKCISYLTIEHKGSISPDLRESLGNHLFGCDACQQACPWNQAVLQKAHPEVKALSLLLPSSIELKTILSMTPTEFRQRFHETPIMRAKFSGLLRNGCVIAGNIGNSELIPLLENWLNNDQIPGISEQVQWAIDRIQNRAQEKTADFE